MSELTKSFNRSSEFAGLRARENELSQKISNGNRSPSVRGGFNPDRERLEIELLEVKLAITEGASAYNRTASDLELLRRTLESELRVARKAYAEYDADLPQVTPLTSYDPESILRQVDERISRAFAVESRQAKRQEAAQRLAATFRAIHEAHGLIGAARKAEGLPLPNRVLPKGDPCSNSPFGSVPQTTVQVDNMLGELESQRHPAPQTSPSAEACHILERKRGLDAFLENAAVEQEKRRLSESGEEARIRLAGESFDAVARQNVRAKASAA